MMERKIECYNRYVQQCNDHNFTVPVWGSDIAKSKKDTHIAKHTRRGDVVM